MSLIAWYKLDGNLLDNSGQNNHLQYVNNSGKLVSATGKINTCYKRNAVNDGADAFRSTNKINLQGDFTMACWAYITACHSGTANGVFVNHKYSTNTGAGISVRDISTTDFRMSCCTGTGTSRTYNAYYGTTNIKDSWHHLLLRFIKSSNELSLWVDGVKEYSMTYAQYNVEDYLELFCWSTNWDSTNYKPAGSIDDARVYDHALSEKEIKELAKAKILHYTFDEFQEPTENEFIQNWSRLLVGNYGGDGVLQPGTSDPFGGTSYPVYRKEGMIRFGVTNGTDIGTLYYGNTYTFSIYLRKIAGTTEPTAMEFDICDRVGSTNFSLSELSYEWKRFWVTAYHDNNSSYHFIDIGHYNTTEVFEWSCPQIENKPYATPFTNGTRTGRVSDNSGYDNHADLALATTPQWTEDSRIGKGAYKFSSKYFEIPTIYLNGNIDWSVSCWVKTSSNGSILTNKSGGPVYNKLCIISSVISYYYYNGSWLTKLGTTNILDNSWHLLTWVNYKNSTMDMYVDGIKDTETFSSALSSSGPVDIIGKDWSSSYFNGQLDDVRIYATALSADDVKELYNTRAQIDDKGNFFLHNINQAGGLVGWWPLSGDTKDYSGFGNDGINNGAVSTTGVLGEADTAYQFTEYTDYISLPAESSLVKSISFWLKEDAVTDWLPFVGQSSTHYLMATTGGVGAFYHSNSGAPIIFRDSQKTLYPAGDTSWHHYVVTNIDISSWTEIKLSGYPTTNWPLEGKVFDVRFYNRILSSGEIEALYNMTEPLPAAMRLHDNGIADFIDISEIGPVKGLVAYYPLNGNAKDYANYNDGTVVGATITAGINGKACYSLDGVDDQINIGGGVNWQEFTMSMWVKPGSTQKDYADIIDNNHTGVRSWAFQQSGSDTNNYGFLNAPSVRIPTDAFHHIILMSKATGEKYVYMDKELISSTNSGQLTYDGTEYIRLGNWGSGGRQWNGLIQNFRIYNRALSLEEINILYDLEIGSTAKVKIDKDTVYLSGEIYEG